MLGTQASIGIVLSDFNGLERTALFLTKDRFTTTLISARVLHAKFGIKVSTGTVMLTPPKLALSVLVVKVANLAWLVAAYKVWFS